jgi:hypothetical protein
MGWRRDERAIYALLTQALSELESIHARLNEVAETLVKARNHNADLEIRNNEERRERGWSPPLDRRKDT